MKLSLFIILSIFRMVVIPVQFEDVDFTISRSDLAATVSKAESYYNHQFPDRTFQFDLAPAVKVSHKMSYYGNNYSSRKDVLLHEAIREACNLLNDEVNFSLYDNNSDGSVDNIILITAGMGESQGSGADYIWAQQGLLQDYGSTLTLDGVNINSFSVSTELQSDNGANPRPSGIGLICHELAHSFGLVDLYDTDGDGSGGLSPGLCLTSLMDRGCLNDDGNTPPNMNAIDLEILGIGKCDTLKIGSYNLKPIDSGRRYLKALTDVEGEYFLFECRSAQNWDAPLGKSGLVVYHIDKSGNPAGYSDYFKTEIDAATRWKKSQINCRPDRMCAEIVCQFFPQSGHTSFGSDTAPAFRFRDGKSSTLALSNISLESDGSVSFKVIEPITIEKINAFQDAAIINWKKDPLAGNASSYTVSWTSGSQTKSIETDGKATGCSIDGLSPLTAYSFTVKMNISDNEKYSVSASFTTKAYRSGTYPYIFLSGTVRNTNGSFPYGAKIPLRIYNATNVQSIEWYFDSQKVTAGSDGYFSLTRSGQLKAVVTHTDGKKETIIKVITIQ